ncbi:MAG: hypothetical protein H7070_00965, partial [Saprospiraceae bacterium]|nr:hypothetical protein [Pyrinomonadaceae bacterium]
RAAAVEIAAVIETKAEGNASQLLALAAFYLGTESGGEARRLAEAAAAIDPRSVTAQQTLGLAHRLNFDLEESAKAYEKALDLDPESSAAKRSLAEMKRALGRSDEAASLYREVLAKYENDIPARTGLILSLFDGGKKAEAETELTKFLELVPNNLNLLAGAAYWYAANDQGDKAVELAQKAVDLEPRFIWSHIALGRGLMKQKKPVDAERVLIRARQHGNFPTLEYEIASARLMSGFYREAVEELQKNFTIKDGTIRTKLGGRVPREEKTFTDLIASERRASIFEPLAAENVENAARLKLLFELSDKLSTAAPNEDEVVSIADEFVKGDDKMKLHRQLYAAAVLLQKKIAVAKAAEFIKAAVGNTDAGLDVAAPAAAVMANELYESRTIAFARGEFVVVPEVPRQMLSAILRGRIEELTGWTLYQQNNYPEAIVRLRRAISVLPDKSAWWRSSVWRLGAALEADGKDKEALENYVRSYKTDKPDVGKYIAIENLYKKLNGGTDGLEAQIGPNPLPTFAAKPEVPVVKAAEPVEPKIESAAPETVPEPAAIVPEPTAAAGSLPERSKAEIPKETAAETKPVPLPETPKNETAEKTVVETVVKAEPISIRETPAIDVPKLVVKEPESTPVPKTGTEDKTILVPEPEVKEKAIPAEEKAEAGSAVPEKKAADKVKSLFEPIIINVPKSAPAKKPLEKDTAAAKTQTDDSISSGAARPRVVDGEEIRSEEPAVCSVTASQENISILNGGGSVGILVGIDSSVKDISALSSSPKDVEVTLEPEIAGVSASRFYIVRSVSTTPGVYQVIFDARCGKKEIIVRVR